MPTKTPHLTPLPDTQSIRVRNLMDSLAASFDPFNTLEILEELCFQAHLKGYLKSMPVLERVR